MRSIHVAAAVLVAGIAAGAGYAWHEWRAQQREPIVRAAVPAIPDLAAWPDEYASRVRAATAVANRLEQPLKALSELACLYHANGFYREAQQVERGLHALEPKNAQWTYYLADACQNLGDMEGTKNYLEESLRFAPHYPLIRLKLAELLFKQGHPDEALTHYEWRLALVPGDPYAQMGLARIALQRGHRTDALRYLEAIVRRHPEFPSAHNLLGELYAQTGDQVRAAEQRRLGSSTGRFIEADDPLLYKVYAWSFDPYRLQVQGAIRLQTRQLEASLPFYEKAVRLAPRDGSAYDALGDLYLQLGRFDDARAALEAGLAAAPDTPALYSTFSQLLRRQRRVPEAIAVLQRGVLRLPALPELRNDLGVTCEEGGRREDAVAAYREAVRLNPHYSEAYLNLGRCLLTLGQADEAQADLQRALALKPGNAEALIALAQQALDAGQWKNAGCCLRALVESGPGTPATPQLLERALAVAQKAGNAEAVRELEQLVARLPK